MLGKSNGGVRQFVEIIECQIDCAAKWKGFPLDFRTSPDGFAWPRYVSLAPAPRRGGIALWPDVEGHLVPFDIEGELAARVLVGNPAEAVYDTVPKARPRVHTVSPISIDAKSKLRFQGFNPPSKAPPVERDFLLEHSLLELVSGHNA
jgi:hypothetical protein